MKFRDHREPRDWRIWKDPPGFFLPNCACCTPAGCTNGTITNLYFGPNPNGEYSLSGDTWTAKTTSTDFQNQNPWQVCSISAVIYVGINSALTAGKAEEYVVDTWTVLTAPTQKYNLPNTVANNAGTSVEAIQVYTTGFFFNERYSVAGNSWANMTAGSHVQNFAQWGQISDTIYIAGGLDSTSSTQTLHESYNILTDGWTAVTSLPASKYAGAFFTFTSSSYYHVAVGVLATTPTYSNTNLRYQTGSWTTKTAATRNHSQCASGSGNTEGVVANGFNNGVLAINNTDSYDPAGDAWTTRGSNGHAYGGNGAGI